jgi:ABC-2 type transport system permease protein
MRAHWRRDRWLLFAWITGGCFLYFSQARSVEEMYPTAEDLQQAAVAMSSNQAMLAMTGPARALDTIGGQVAWQSAAYGAVVAGLMSMLIVGRHTRMEEETGRAELIRAGAVDRLAPLASAVGIALMANVVLGGVVCGGLIAYGLPAAGSVALGASLTLAGWFFAGVAAVAAQLSVGTRTAYAITSVAIGASFFVRGLGDAGPAAVSWFSPIGWGQATRPFADERWWPLALSAAATGGLLTLAVWLHDRRDYGTGLWTLETGRSSDTDIGGWALAWRLHRGTIIGWSIALLVSGLGYGALADSADEVLGDSSFTADLFAGTTLVDGFLGTAVLTLALLAAAAAVMSALRPDAEERAGRVEHLLASPLPRSRWALQHTVVTVLGTIAVLVSAGVGTGIGHAAMSADAGAMWPPVAAALSYLPAVLVVTAVIRLAHGLGRAPAVVGWTVLAWCSFVGMFGDLMDLPSSVTMPSPFDHVARMPADQFAVVPWIALCGVALCLSAAGHVLLARRDLR